jgi:hypothetical protein
MTVFFTTVVDFYHAGADIRFIFFNLDSTEKIYMGEGNKIDFLRRSASLLARRLSRKLVGKPISIKMTSTHHSHQKGYQLEENE